MYVGLGLLGFFFVILVGVGLFVCFKQGNLIPTCFRNS